MVNQGQTVSHSHGHSGQEPFPRGLHPLGSLVWKQGHQLSLVTVTAVTVISEPWSMCSVPITVHVPQDPAPFQHHTVPPWGRGILQVPTRLRWKQRLMKLRELPEAQQLVVLESELSPESCGGRRSLTRWEGHSADGWSDRRPGTSCTCWSPLTSPCMDVLFPQPGVGIWLPAHQSLESRDITALKPAGSSPAVSPLPSLGGTQAPILLFPAAPPCPRPPCCLLGSRTEHQSHQTPSEPLIQLTPPQILLSQSLT